VIFRLELVTVPVSDIDRAKAFYVDQVGFIAEQDHQVDEAPPLCGAHAAGLAVLDIALTTGYIDAEPRSLQGIQLNVDAPTRATPSCATAASMSPTSKRSRGAASASSQIPTATAGRCTGRRDRASRAVPPESPAVLERPGEAPSHV
jgi:hypothetical protein